MTNRHIAYVTLLVRDYDEVKAWYCDVLGFDLIEDTPLEDGKHWLLVAPCGPAGTYLLLATANTKREAEFFSFYRPMISGKTFVQCGVKELASRKTLVRRATAPLQYLKIFMAIFGILYN